jgi:hypothetical protein
MRRALVILTKPLEPLDERVVREERALPNTEIEVIDLTVAEPDYARLLDAVFAADSVQVW